MQDYIKIIEDDMPEQIQFLQDLIRVNSEGSDAVTAADGSVYPFGQGVQDALELVHARIWALRLITLTTTVLMLSLVMKVR